MSFLGGLLMRQVDVENRKSYFEQIHDKMTLLLAGYFDGDVLDYLSLIALTAITI